MSRDIRRHHEHRMKKKAERISRDAYGENDRFAKMHNNLKACSCVMCGNPRKWFGEVTRQEAQVDVDWE